MQSEISFHAAVISLAALLALGGGASFASTRTAIANDRDLPTASLDLGTDGDATTVAQRACPDGTYRLPAWLDGLLFEALEEKPSGSVVTMRSVIESANSAASLDPNAAERTAALTAFHRQWGGVDIGYFADRNSARGEIVAVNGLCDEDEIAAVPNPLGEPASRTAAAAGSSGGTNTPILAAGGGLLLVGIGLAAAGGGGGGGNDRDPPPDPPVSR